MQCSLLTTSRINSLYWANSPHVVLVFEVVNLYLHNIYIVIGVFAHVLTVWVLVSIERTCSSTLNITNDYSYMEIHQIHPLSHGLYNCNHKIFMLPWSSRVSWPPSFSWVVIEYFAYVRRSYKISFFSKKERHKTKRKVIHQVIFIHWLAHSIICYLGRVIFINLFPHMSLQCSRGGAFPTLYLLWFIFFK